MMTGGIKVSNNIIEIKGLKKEFKVGKESFQALRGIDLDVPKGSIYGIVGLSGAGKSTLVRCMNGLEYPDEGEILLDGCDITKLRGKKLRLAKRSMGMIFQHFNLLMQANVEKNVCFPLDISGVSRKEALSKVDELIDIVGLSDKKKVYPAQLSGGQKQRVAIARALVHNPKLLLCDEATSALDSKTTRSILDLLVEINRTFGTTIVLITHQMQVAQEICTHLALIDEGIVAECGRAEELFINPRTEALKSLLLHNTSASKWLVTEGCCRIAFDAQSTYEPIIADLVLECQAKVNILFADVETVEGRSYGQMVIELPKDVEEKERVLSYLKRKRLIVEEEEDVN